MSCCSDDDLKEREMGVYSKEAWVQSVAICLGFGGVILIAFIAIALGGK